MTGGTGTAYRPSIWSPPGQGPGAGPAHQPPARQPVTGLDLGPLPGAVPCARGHARNVLHEWAVHPDRVDVAELVISELVTNAVHATARLPGPVPMPVRVRLRDCPGYVLIEVGDSSLETPIVQKPESDIEHGRGLLLIGELSIDWGWHYMPAIGGKVVWAKVARSDGINP
jgi:anti-sigma regulatory factor (Ser/Thr protein kinase)